MKFSIRHITVKSLGSLLVGIALAASGGTAQAHMKSSAPLPLKVVGVEILNSQNEPVLLRGVDAASMEWTSNGEGHILTTVKTAIQDWHANIIRLPLSQDRWFGKAPEQTDGGKAYRALVKQVVDACTSLGSYIILDLHWSDAGEWGKQIGQHKMPDRNSLAFWKDFAPVYKNYPSVLFDLYNEPHDVSWEVWLKGGDVTEKNRKTGMVTAYQAVGMQTLLNAVRSAGAKNVVVAGGLNWAYDMSGILNGYQLSDPTGDGVIYANHNYPFKGETVAQWAAEMETATKKFPVIVSEFGGEPKNIEWIRQVLQIMHDHNWNWTAWDMHPSAGPCLISDWNYTPTPYYGIFVKEALLGTLPPYTTPIPASSP